LSSNLLEFTKSKVLAVQDFVFLSARAVHNLIGRPRYLTDTLVQMDVIGVGSLPIVILTGFFTGAVLALQTSQTLQSFGEISLTGELVAKSLVRELGPVLGALMVAGRNATGMASELGSMLVSEQIDAMRALGTDPTKKLVTPRLVATVVMLPLLTIIADFVGLAGGFMVSFFIIRMDPVQYWTTAYQSLHFADVFQGMIKPFFFGFIVAMVGCYYGMSTRGGTQGVGRSTTQAMVVASVLIIASDFFITKILMTFLV
jgi:phospholipid/cholesterol/gamma-HCH transport system permease protein